MDINLNYDKLRNLPQINYYKFVMFIIVIVICLIILAGQLKITKKYEVYGIYKDNILEIKIENTLSDIIKNNQYIKFKNIKAKYEIVSFGNVELIDNIIYQDIYLTVDKKFFDNEFGIVEIYYQKISILKYIFQLFK